MKKFSEFRKKCENIFWGIVVFMIFLWAFKGTEISLLSLVKGAVNLVDFVGRLFPPDLTVARVMFLKILETIQMAIVGGTLGALIAFPLSFLAARNVVSNKIIYQSVRGFFDTLRGIHEMVWALIFVSMVGLGPFPGVLALTVHVTGALGKYFSEAIETANPEVVRAVVSTGANKIQVVIRAIFPEIKPLFFSYYLYYLEHNFRAATVLGLVGAGGIGMELIVSIRLFSYHKLLTILIMMIVTIILLDRLSAYIRRRITDVKGVA